MELTVAVAVAVVVVAALVGVAGYLTDLIAERHDCAESTSSPPSPPL